MTIYWLTGAMGAGKSTLGAALAASLPKTLFIDGDFLLVDSDKIPFAERIMRTKNQLIETCISFAKDKQSVVIAYPVTKETIIDLKQKFELLNAKLIVIGIQSPLLTTTRTYSEWQLQRQKEMIACNGKGFADIVFKHPTQYLNDSINELIKELNCL
jgi:shikimate kinase